MTAPEPNRVTLDLEDGLGVISLRRPKKLNALTPVMLDDLDRALASAVEDQRVRVIVLRGEGTSFCSGADTVEALGTGDPKVVSAFVLKIASVLTRISSAPKPVIAAIQGHAAGGGAEIALEADFRVASEDAQLWYPDTRIGSTPASLWQLVRLTSKGLAAEMIMLGRRLGAEEMQQLGVVQTVVPGKQLDEAARELAHRLQNEVTALSLRHAKEALQLAYSAARETELRANANAQLACYASTLNDA